MSPVKAYFVIFAGPRNIGWWILFASWSSAERSDLCGISLMFWGFFLCRRAACEEFLHSYF